MNNSTTALFHLAEQSANTVSARLLCARPALNEVAKPYREVREPLAGQPPAQHSAVSQPSIAAARSSATHADKILEGLCNGIEDAGHAMAVLNAQGQCQFINKEFERLLGWPLEAVLNRSLEDVAGFRADSSIPVGQVLRTVQACKAYSGTLTLQTKGAGRIGVAVTASPIRGHSEASSYLLVIFTRLISKAPEQPVQAPSVAAQQERATTSIPFGQSIPEQAGAASDPAAQDSTVHLSPHQRRVTIGEECIILTRVEYRVFEVLLSSQGQWVSASELLARAFGPDYAAHDSLIRVHVHKIRKKLGSFAPRIRSAKGRGYLFV